jgi:hypothetical protein
MKNRIENLAKHSSAEPKVDDLWRRLLTGKQHVTLANYISSSFQILLTQCEKHEILKKNATNASKLNVTDVDDLSDASKLITTRFETLMLTKSGHEMKATLPTAIQVFIHSSSSELCSRLEIDTLRKAAYRGLQFEIVCRQINYSRNLNAHSNASIEDLGHASALASSILRLQELFEPPVGIEESIEEINNICGQILHLACQSLLPDKKYNTYEEGPSLKGQPNDNISTNLDGRPAIDAQIGVEGFNLPIEYDAGTATREIKRQKLMVLRRTLIRFMSAELPDIKRSKCLLTKQSIHELLSKPLDNLEEIKTLPSFKYNFANNSEISNKQMQFVRRDLLEILLG